MSQDYEVFVRAKSPTGKWHAASALDLDDRSFRRFVLMAMAEAGIVTAIRPDATADLDPLVSTTEPQWKTK